MKTIVIGGSFAGITAAIQVKRKLKEKAEVLLIDRNEDFLFIPSLIWVRICHEVKRRWPQLRISNFH